MRWTLLILVLLLVPFVEATTIELEAFPNGVIMGSVSNADHVQLSSEPLDLKGMTDIQLVDNIYDISFDNELSFRWTDVVSIQNQQHVFSQQFFLEESSTISLKLPEGFILADIPTAVLPQPNITSDGRTLTLTWETDEPIELIVIYERSYKQGSNAASIATIIIVIIIALFLVLGIGKKTKNHLKQTLGENELSIMRLLASKGGKMSQKELVKASHYSKSRISKLLARLEQKGFIERSSDSGLLKIKVKRKI